MHRFFAVSGAAVSLAALLLCRFGIGLALPFAVVFCVCAAAALVIALRRKRLVTPIALALGVIFCISFYHCYTTEYAPVCELDGRKADLTATVTSYSENYYGRFRYDAVTESLNGQSLKVRLRLSFNSKLPVTPGDRIEGTFTLRKSSGGLGAVSVDGDGFSATAYPSGKGSDSYSVIPVAESEKRLIDRITVFRERVRKRLISVIPGEKGELSAAMLLGKGSDFPERLNDSFRAAGVSHIICVSGLHLSVWALLVLKILMRMKLKFKFSAPISAAFVVLVMAVTGFPYSIVRAGIMMIIFLLSIALYREPDGLNSLGLAVTAILIADPFAVLNIGFQLSALSTAGIIIISPPVNAAIERLDSTGRVPDILMRLISYLSSAAALCLAALVFTMPVILFNFGSVNLIALVVNLLILPVAAPFLFASGLTALFISFTGLRVLGLAGAAVTSLLAKYLITVVDFFARFSSLTFYPDKRVCFVCLLICFAVLTAIVMFFADNSLIYSGGSVFAVACVLCCVLISDAVLNRQSFVGVTDVGDAVAVTVTRGDKTAVIGCGKDSPGSGERIMYSLDETGCKTLDFMLLPSEEKAVGGAAGEILTARPVSRLVASEPPLWLPPGVKPAETLSLNGFYSEDVWDGFSLTCVERDGISAARLEINGTVFLLCFDPKSDMRSMPDSLKKADILITSSYVPYALSPEDYGCVIISGNEESKAGRDALSAEGISAFDTAVSGNIVVGVRKSGAYYVRNGNY